MNHANCIRYWRMSSRVKLSKEKKIEKGGRKSERGVLLSPNLDQLQLPYRAVDLSADATLMGT